MILEEQIIELKKLINHPQYGLKDSSNTNKNRYAIYAAVDELIEAAKTEERKRIEEALVPNKKMSPYERNHGMKPHSRDTLTNAYRNGFNDCLDQVRSIINPQSNE